MGILDAPGVSARTVLRARSAGLRGFPVADNTFALLQPAGSLRTASGTSRIPHTIVTACTDLRLTFVAWTNTGTTLTPNYADSDLSGVSFSFTAGVEIGSTIYRITFGGQTTASLTAGSMITSDPLPVEIAAGTVIYSRTFLAGTPNWSYNKYSFLTPGSGGFAAASDLTAPGSGAVADSAFAAQYGPALITGTPLTGQAPPVALIVGDSIGHGYGDAPGTVSFQGRNIVTPQVAGGGYLMRGLYGKVAAIQVAFPGDNGASFLPNVGHFRRMTFASLASTMICEYGRNDISGGASLASMQATLLGIWAMGANRGMRVIQTTITPRCSSTDGWTTTTNQTPINGEAVRTATNDWLRAGAPIINGAGVAAGTPGAVLAGQAGHPLFAVWDAADLAETARNSGLWKPMANTRTVADAAIGNGGGALTSATAGFTTADVGRNVTVAGAGTAGGLLTAMIYARSSGTAVNVDINAGASVSGAALTIGDGPTTDGLHPSAYMAAQISGCVNTAQII